MLFGLGPRCGVRRRCGVPAESPERGESIDARDGYREANHEPALHRALRKRGEAADAESEERRIREREQRAELLRFAHDRETGHMVVQQGEHAACRALIPERKEIREDRRNREREDQGSRAQTRPREPAAGTGEHENREEEEWPAADRPLCQWVARPPEAVQAEHVEAEPITRIRRRLKGGEVGIGDRQRLGMKEQRGNEPVHGDRTHGNDRATELLRALPVA